LMGLEGNYGIYTAGSTGLEVAMNVYRPPGYDSSVNATGRYPLLVWLGGSGEIGDPDDYADILEESTSWGPSREIRFSDRDYPFMVVTPVCWEYWPKKPHALNAMVEYLKANYRIDADRVHFAGLCTGAAGVMEYAQVYHYQLASILAVIPISEPWRPSRLAELPTWIFHSFGERPVPRRYSITWANAIANAVVATPDCMATYPYGPDQSGSLYDETGTCHLGAPWGWKRGIAAPADSLLHLTLKYGGLHQIWQVTINDPTVLHWLLKQRRQSPFSGSPVLLPGRIEAERFDFGGYGRAYVDKTMGNGGLNPYRVTANPADGVGDDEQVDLASGGSGVVLTDTEVGEWSEFSVSSAASGQYALRLRVSAASSGGALRLMANGAPITGSIPIPATIGFSTVTIPGVALNAGPQLLRVVVEAGGFDLDWFEFSAESGSTDIIVDNRQSDKVATSGPWTLTNFTPGFYATDYLSAAPGSDCAATFRPILPNAGLYEVFMQYPANSARGVSPVSITHEDGGSVFSTSVDQRQNGGTWVLLGTFGFSAGPSASVTIRSLGAGGYVSADAVRFRKVNSLPAIDLIVDNDDAGRVVIIGAWTASTVAAGYFGANYVSTAPSSANRVVYRPNLARSGLFTISMWYPATPSRGISPVTIAYGDGTETTTITVDQRGNGGQWNSLGTFPLEAGSGPTVTIGCFDSGGWIGADAIRFQETALAAAD
jgi:hypothetical protein